MSLTAPFFVNQAAIKSAVLDVEKRFSPQVVRIGYSFREDHFDNPAIFFRILLRDEAVPIDIELDRRISVALMNEAMTDENGLRAYFSYRSVSEQHKLRDPEWD